MNVFIVPRWGATPDDVWYRSLEASLSPEADVRVTQIAMPNPQQPILVDWLTHLHETLPKDPAVLAQTILIGHSVSCRALLAFIQELPTGVHVAGLLCVAGWWTIDKPWPSLMPWVEMDVDDDRIRQRCRTIRVLFSDNDPFTSDWVALTAEWKRRLDVEVWTITGAGHFNGPNHVAIYEAALATIADVRRQQAADAP